jgi:DNA-directed RNA polymerase specialized sigma24 family protein
MDSTHSYTRLIGLIKGGDRQAARELYGRLYDWLLGQARSRLRGTHLLLTQPEDLASRAFERFGECVRRPQVHNRHDLMRALVRVMHNYARSKARYERLPSARRGGGEVIRGGDEVGRAPDRSPAAAYLPAETRARLSTLPLGGGAGGEADDEAADWQGLNDRCLGLLDALTAGRPDAKLQEVALLAWIGYTEEEIAGQLGYALRTVERKVKLVKEIWSKELDDA